MAVFGDAEAAAVAILTADPAIAALGARVSTDLVGYSAPARWLRVVRTGGTPTLWMHVDNAELSIGAWAESKFAALDLAGAARAALFAARGAYQGHGLSLFDVADGDGMGWEADESTGAARYVFTLTLVTRPA